MLSSGGQPIDMLMPVRIADEAPDGQRCEEAHGGREDVTS